MALGSSALAATGIAAAASQLLKPAASKGAHFTASDHPGAVDRHRHRRAIRPFPGARRAARRPAVRHALPGRKPIAPRPLSQRPLPLPNAQCPTPNAKCPTPNPNAHCPLPIAQCQQVDGRFPEAAPRECGKIYSDDKAQWGASSGTWKLCSGLFLLQPGNASLDFVDAWAERLEAKQAGAKNQPHYNAALAQSNLSATVLPCDLFPNGHRPQHQTAAQTPT